MLARIQNDLFDLGADLCVPESGKRGGSALRIIDAQVDRLEREIDAMNAELKPLTSFVLPSGTPAAAHLHLARTVVRRAERLIVEFSEKEKLRRRSGQIYEPAVGSSVRRQPLRERQRRERRFVDSGRKQGRLIPACVAAEDECEKYTRHARDRPPRNAKQGFDPSGHWCGQGVLEPGLEAGDAGLAEDIPNLFDRAHGDLMPPFSSDVMRSAPRNISATPIRTTLKNRSNDEHRVVLPHDRGAAPVRAHAPSTLTGGIAPHKNGKRRLTINSSPLVKRVAFRSPHADARCTNGSSTARRSFDGVPTILWRRGIRRSILVRVSRSISDRNRDRCPDTRSHPRLPAVAYPLRGRSPGANLLRLTR